MISLKYTLLLTLLLCNFAVVAFGLPYHLRSRSSKQFIRAHNTPEAPCIRSYCLRWSYDTGPNKSMMLLVLLPLMSEIRQGVTDIEKCMHTSPTLREIVSTSLSTKCIPEKKTLNDHVCMLYRLLFKTGLQPFLNLGVDHITLCPTESFQNVILFVILNQRRCSFVV